MSQEDNKQIILEKLPCLGCKTEILICDLHKNLSVTEKNRNDLKKAGVIFVREGYHVKCPDCKKIMVVK